ncbi:hypothetical protein [Methanolobus sp.]|uniref:hypothetical protein n=1 Tax=Methanolobus sp. TaxID=1874737 RepID=UPI00258E8DC1|nr:hypothetical protein [Methanolobus sp.]
MAKTPIRMGLSLISDCFKVSVFSRDTLWAASVSKHPLEAVTNKKIKIRDNTKINLLQRLNALFFIFVFQQPYIIFKNAYVIILENHIYYRLVIKLYKSTYIPNIRILYICRYLSKYRGVRIDPKKELPDNYHC